MSVELCVLGPLEVRLDNRPVPIPAGRARVLLASLLLRANEVVPADRLVDRLWDGAPPNASRARATLHMVVTRLRQALGPANVVRTAAEGYVADVPPGSLDLHRYRELAARGRFAEALELWRGEPLADVRSDSLHREEVVPLLEERLAVLERRVDADLAAGRAAELVPELRALTRRHPLHERFWAQLMRALQAADQWAEALAVYEAVRAHLADELGIAPGPALRELHARLLAGVQPPPGAPPAVVPRQLPPPVDFAGRADLVAELAAELAGTGDHPSCAVVAGPPGIGKTALAVHVAHLLRDRFPDGQLFADLRAYAPSSAVTVSVVLPRFLRALGVAPEDVPGDREEQAARYRSLLAGRRVLVVLDNVPRDEAVELLLPGHPGSAAVMTTRDCLLGLVGGSGARRFDVEPLHGDESLTLLRGVLGDAVLDAAPEAAAALAETCAHWPLALRIAGVNLASRPVPDLAGYVAELRREDRLEALAIGDEEFALRAAFDSSYVGLDAEARAAFRLLGLVPGDDVSTAAAAALLGVEVREAQRLLRGLAAASLVSERSGRFALHDLLREYAAGLAAEEEDEATRHAALRRLLDFYVDTALNAAAAVRSVRPDVSTGVARERALGFADRDQALEWWEVERANLCAATSHATRSGHAEHAWRLPIAQWSLFDLTKRFAETVPALELAARAAREVGDPRALTLTARALAMTYSDADRPEDAIRSHHVALEVHRRAGDRRGEGLALNALAICHLKLGRDATAVDMLEESRRLLVAVGDQHGEAITLNTLSGVLARLGRVEEAVEASSRALRLVEGSGDLVVEGRVLDNHGNALAAAGRVDEAVAAYRLARARAAEARDQSTEAAVLENLARALTTKGDVTGARASWAAALALLPEGSAAADRVRARLAEP
ncbi:AfsR/SARP family transcriptional regulator [Saccharothrix syringae]|uniref:AfsR/SARP family transcriptional regulator n=1 Tax=Saccharothrix syringae TaxID=103733 RepID=UPI00068BA35E|nr:AfsR/SARP family transcriptional regulator [Saccharothrix syringae]